MGMDKERKNGRKKERKFEVKYVAKIFKGKKSSLSNAHVQSRPDIQQA